jgi:hypothetical protein
MKLRFNLMIRLYKLSYQMILSKMLGYFIVCHTHSDHGVFKLKQV